MNNFKIFTLSFLIGILFLGTKVLAQTGEDLYQKGIQLEEIKGELEKAIEVYSTVIRDNTANKETAALAQLHIGLCYEKLGKEKIADAISSFKKVINLYPSQKDAVQLAREKLAALNTNENDIQEIKNAVEKWNKAFESKDIDKYCSFLSNEFINRSLGSLTKMREFIVNRYFSKWKKISLTSKIKSVERTGYNYVVDEEVNFVYTDWNGGEKSEMGVNRFLTFTQEKGQWKVLSLRNQMPLPGIYKKLSNKYPGVGNPYLAYVCQAAQRFVSVIDTRTDSLIGIINSGYGPCDITFSKDRGYIANFNSNDITVFNKKDNAPIATVPVGSHPTQILITEDGKFALILHQSDDGLWIMTTKDNQIINKIPSVTGIPLYNFSNNKIYISAIFTPYIIVMKPDDQSIVKKIDVGGRPLNIALTPDGKFLYVANSILNEVQKINTHTDSIVNTISNVDTCRGIAITPDDKFAYVTNVVSSKVTIINLQNDKIEKTIPVGRMPTTIIMDKYNNCAYVSNQRESSISVIDLKKQEVVKTISVADNPISIQMFPNNQK